MEEIVWFDWMAGLTFQDQTWLMERYRRAKSDEERIELLEEAEEMVNSAPYAAMIAVRCGRALTPKGIVMPVIPTHDSRIREEWARIRDDQTEGSVETWGELYASIYANKVAGWVGTVRRFEDNPDDFFNAFEYLDNHPAFIQFCHDDGKTSPDERVHYRNLWWEGGIHRAVNIAVFKVDPRTGCREDDVACNTLTQVWIELGRIGWPGSDGHGEPLGDGGQYHRDGHYHDPDADCGGGTVEEAIVTAAIYVHTLYGNDRRICDALREDGDDS